MTSSRFAGKTALVTGAAGGIGLAIAQRLTREACRVLLTDIDAARLDATAATLAGSGAEIATEVADLADASARERLIPSLLKRWGRIDVLVNNAADHGPRTPFVELSDREWERVFATNVTATSALCRAAAHDMLARGGGAIVNVTSVQVDLPVPTYAAYVASKGAIMALTRALAVELSPRGVRVNAVAPGVIATASFQHALGAPAASAGGPTAALLARHGTPEEVATAVAFLASEEASFVTGTTLYVEGGRSISRRPDPFQSEFGDRPAGGIS